jgi:hypothetical protein
MQSSNLLSERDYLDAIASNTKKICSQLTAIQLMLLPIVWASLKYLGLFG